MREDLKTWNRQPKKINHKYNNSDDDDDDANAEDGVESKSITQKRKPRVEKIPCLKQ